ncbi:MAG: RHS repeat-associated core domain-containing protein, partial [Longicatena sp.]
KVIRPDQTEVTFKYDSLGRRIEKSSNEKTTQFVWDGNTILHEYFSRDNSEKSEIIVEHSSENNSEIPDNLVTWVFNDGFVPSAKITSEGNYSIISDYLGTPVEAFDEEGNKVWSAELDIYGRVKEFAGDKDFVPFRYQGQYEDAEIGLYYNRFRYYDPEQGNYTQQDPIGLAGGNPTLYGYVSDPNRHVDTFGLYNGEGVRELGVYDVFHSHLLKSSEFTNTDAYHFSKANESLHKAFQNDPAFKAAMEAKYPGISKHVAPTRLDTYRGTAPKGTTWHHATSSQVNGQKGWLQIVDQKDHSKYHKIYHPDDIGGRNEWGGGTTCRKK